MFYHLAEEIVWRYPLDPTNALRYDKVVVNTIGTPEYNPALPNKFKWDLTNNYIVGDLVAYVDGLWTLGCSIEEAWRTVRQVASQL